MKIVREKGLPFSRFNDGNYADKLAPDVVATVRVNQPKIDPRTTKFIGMRHLYMHSGLAVIKGVPVDIFNFLLFR